ncbi:MAG: tRNA 4-thiouridine(8) synthase ThiI [Clostridiales bacterium]|nr:tRNA 4-thiouridine(8) synthase ThiI [Clostridiales bacterium]
MNEIILLKCGELVLKGLNRAKFEEWLMKTLRYRLRPFGHFSIYSLQSTIYIEPEDGFDTDSAMEALPFVFGIVSVCRSYVCEKNLEEIKSLVTDAFHSELSAARTFKVQAKRSDKKFRYDSMDIMREVGGHVLSVFPHLTVDVHSPELTVHVEVRDRKAYVHIEPVEGAGGLPCGINGKATVLISGGIDSPVAAYLMARRGLELHAVHFFSYPYTSEQAKEKVFELLRLVSRFAGRIYLQVVPFTEIQESIREHCPEDLFTLVMRRFMMRISSRLARACRSDALITGESLGQVASQTLLALAATDNVCDMPVFRPVIGFDKKDIVAIARSIGTFDTSILPYEDCCTVFTPKHPKTKPMIYELEEAEKALDIENLIERAIAGVQDVAISPSGAEIIDTEDKQ